MILSSFALERDGLDHLYPDTADALDLKFDYQIYAAADFSSNAFADPGHSSRVIGSYSPTISYPSAVQVWTDEFFIFSDLNDDTACLVWT